MVKLKSSLLPASLSISTLMSTLIPASIAVFITAIFTAFFTTTAHATEVNQATIDAVKEKIVASCPVRWEDHSKSLVLPTLASDDIWENTDDRSAFVTYITEVLTELGSSNSPDDLANDANTVAAECATHRTALLDLLLVKEPNDLVLSMRAMKHNLDELAAAGSDGASRETAAKDCKAIKGAFPDSTDGTYWIDVTGGSSNDAIEVFCDMTTDGGGWTFVAYQAYKSLNNPVEMLSFFNTAVGEYQVSRAATADHYSLGILPELKDTEMMMVGESSDAETSKQLQRFAQYKYDVSAPAFNFGPIPCSPSGFEYKTALLDEYQKGHFYTCTESSFYLYSFDNTYSTKQIMILNPAYPGFYSGPKVRGSGKAYLNKTWFYVR